MKKHLFVDDGMTIRLKDLSPIEKNFTLHRGPSPKNKDKIRKLQKKHYHPFRHRRKNGKPNRLFLVNAYGK